MGSWYKKKILFPSKVEYLYDSTLLNINKSSSFNLDSNKFTIVHFFTADCDKCINELIKIQNVLKYSSEYMNVNCIFISSAPTKYYVLKAISKVKFPYPIYYEEDYYSFKTINKFPISEDIYNTMLLNTNKEIILFGAFYDNKKARKLYLNAINCNL
jgi:hypothetical protein